ncbi:MAG: hypothetical protein ACI4OR_03265 [Alphaproteobacteria bacterium]
MKKLFLLLMALLLAGCTYSKPVVTEIIQDKDGRMTIEKCQIQYHPFVGIMTKNCSYYRT